MLWPKVRALLAGLARRNHLEDELAEEIRGHIEERANELARSGVDPSRRCGTAVWNSARSMSGWITAEWRGKVPFRLPKDLDDLTAIVG